MEITARGCSVAFRAFEMIGCPPRYVQRCWQRPALEALGMQDMEPACLDPSKS